jgi:hypothetical protein
MKPLSTKLAGAAALFVLFGSTSLALAQAEDHETHHPEAATVTAQAQDQPDAAPMPQSDQSMMRMTPEMMQQMQRMMMGGQSEGMGPDMMPRSGMMGAGMMGPHESMGPMMRMMLALMDADGSGALSSEEFAEAHDRIFNAMDADGDGELTPEEVHAFVSGPARQAGQTPIQQGMPMRQDMQDAPATLAYRDAMQTMMQGMAGMEVTGDAARDFALMMIPHHQSAIDMAEAFLEHSDDPQLTELANAIITEQRREIEFLQNWLAELEQ